MKLSDTRQRRAGPRVLGAAARIAVTGWLAGVAATWLLLDLLRGTGGLAGLAARLLGAGPYEAVALSAAATGAPVTVRVPALGTVGQWWPAQFVPDAPWLLAAALVPLTTAVLVGWLAARAAARHGTGTGWLLFAAAVSFGLVGGAAAGLGQWAAPDARVAVAPLWAMAFSMLWAYGAGWLGVALHAALSYRAGVAVGRRRAAATVAALALALVLPSAGPAAADNTCIQFPERCSWCPVLAATSDSGAMGLEPDGPNAQQIADSLYAYEAYLESGQGPGLTYLTAEYRQHSRRLVDLMRSDQWLLRDAAHALQTWQPVFATAGTPAGDQTVVSYDMVAEANSLATAFATADMRSFGGGPLAQTLQSGQSRIDTSALVGLTANQAMSYLNAHAA